MAGIAITDESCWGCRFGELHQINGGVRDEGPSGCYFTCTHGLETCSPELDPSAFRCSVWGGTTLNLFEQEAVRHQVALRDDYRCILHPERHGNSIHHLDYRSGHASGSPLIWRMDNMATLCNECHDEAHQHPKEMRQRLQERMTELYQYQYEEET